MDKVEQHLRKQIDALRSDNDSIVSEVSALTKALGHSVAQNERLEKELEITQKSITDYSNFYSYKLGHIIISSKSFKDIICLPWNIYQLRKQYKQKRTRSLLTKVDKKLVQQRNLIAANLTENSKNVKFIAVLDEISFVSWSQEFTLFELNMNNYIEQIKLSTSQGLFLESCWAGNFGRWNYAFTSPGLKHQNAQHLLKAISVAKGKRMPVIFWNKEDPMHYDKFLPIAQRCDVIFTTDSNKVKDYQRDIPNAHVEALAFAANIALCNPKDRFRTKEPGSICFAGSYYSVGHDDRKQQMDRLLPTIPEFNGAIYDRMSKIEGDRYAYPPQYKPFIKEAVPFKEVIDVYKKFKIFLNVNTIVDSPTMMSRRVYELLACGTPVISTPSLALEKQFPDIVQIANNSEEAIEIAKELLEDEWKWSRLSHLGYREVMLKHTYKHRTKQVEEAIGIFTEEKQDLVTIAAVTNRPEFIERLGQNILQQTHEKLELIFVLQNYTEEHIAQLQSKLASTGREYEGIHIIIDESDSTLGARLNKAIELSTGDYLVKMDDDDFYFPNYIQDMLIPFSFGDYGIVGKKEIFIYLEEEDKTIVRYKNERHKETDFVAGATLVISRKALNQIEFGNKNRGEDSSLLEAAKAKGIKVYSADPFNFIVWRGRDKNRHTWQVNDEFFMKNASFVGVGICVNIGGI